MIPSLHKKSHKKNDMQNNDVSTGASKQHTTIVSNYNIMGVDS